MKVELRKSFSKDADKLPVSMQRQLAVIIVHIQNARQLQEIRDCKKLKGHKTAYRIRLGSYRIAFYYENECAGFLWVALVLSFLIPISLCYAFWPGFGKSVRHSQTSESTDNKSEGN